MRLIAIIILGFMFCHQVFAQLTLRPVPKRIPEKAHVNSRIARVAAVTDTINLPFWDDFSYISQDPDTSFWLYGADVLVNSGEGINPPTFNVATFDGLNAAGRPHSDSEFVAPGDSLVSRSIDLSVVDETKRPTVYLSFFWQMQGLGELPDEKDSIRLQFWRADSTWITLWRINGTDSNLSNEFTKEYISVNNEAYFHKGFKFRFQSFGKTTGPFDAWHLDYIYLNQDRTDTNESIFDHAIATEPVSIFNTYTNIPYDQLFAFPDTIFAQYSVGIASQENNPQPVEYVYNIVDTIANQLIHTENTNSTPLPALGRSTIHTGQIDNSIFNSNTDSLVVQTEFQFISGDKLLIKSINNGGADTTFLISDSLNYRINDTLRRTHVIHETLSYDDGTAEFAAGINQKNGKIAVAYTIATADTLTALDIYFPVIEPTASGQAITFSVMRDLSSASGTTAIRQDELVRYSSKINEFVRYELVRPIIVSGTFFIVFEQVRDEFIGIGLDKNNPQPDKIYSNTFGEWEQNTAINVDGSLMFRAIFENTNEVITGVEETISENILVFPNPARDKVNIKGNYLTVKLFTISGEELPVDIQHSELNVSELQNGIYFIQIETSSSTIAKKLIVSH